MITSEVLWGFCVIRAHWKSEWEERLSGMGSFGKWGHLLIDGRVVHLGPVVKLPDMVGLKNISLAGVYIVLHAHSTMNQFKMANVM